MVEIIPHTTTEPTAVQNYLDKLGINLDTRTEDDGLTIA
jgi:hypothetical protein